MRGLVLSLTLVLSLSPAGCRSRPAPNQTPSGGASTALGTEAHPTASEDPPSAEGAPSTARLARCGWGELKVERGVEAPPWAIALVDIEVQHPTKGLRIEALELAGSEVVAKSGERRSLRVQDGAVRYTFAATDTHEIEAVLPVGTFRLRAASALDRPAKAILPRKPTRCTVAFVEADGRELVATGPVDPAWENE